MLLPGQHCDHIPGNHIKCTDMATFTPMNYDNYCCLWILIVRLCILIIIYVFLLLSMYS